MGPSSQFTTKSLNMSSIGQSGRCYLTICRFRSGRMAEVVLDTTSGDVITSHIRRGGGNLFFNQVFGVEVWDQNGDRVFGRDFSEERMAQHVFNQFKMQMQSCEMGMQPTIREDPAWT